MNCSNPIDAAVLSDYWLGLLESREEDGVDEHLLECDGCGERLREVIGLAEGLRRLAREASLRMVVSHAFLRRASEEGLRVQEYAPPPGGGVECTVKAEDDILIGRLAADLSGAKRVDLSICDEHGVERQRMADIPVHGGTSSVLFQESITFAKALPSSRMIARLVRVDEGGVESIISEYTFNHTRSLPGPGAWLPV